MGNGPSITPNPRPVNLTFTFEVEGGIITVNTKKSVQTIEEADREVFNLTDQDQIIQRYFQKDVLARHVYSSNPSDYTLRWERVARAMYPVNARIVNRSNKLVTVQRTELKNPSAVKGKFTWNVNKSEITKETYKYKWFAETTFKSKINLAFKILTLGTIDFSRNTTETVELEQHRSSQLSTQTEIKVTLEPNTSVRVELQAIFHTIEIEVEYEAYLFGALGINFYGLRLALLQVAGLSQLAGVPKTAAYKEIITLEYYTDGDRITMTTIADTNDTTQLHAV